MKICQDTIRKKVAAGLYVLLPFFLLLVLSTSPINAKAEGVNVRLEVISAGADRPNEPGQPLPVKICFDFLRKEQNYSIPFQYEIALFCDDKNVAREKGTFEPPDGVAIKRTTICKTLKFTPRDFVKPQTSKISLRAAVDVTEKSSGRIEAESSPMEVRLVSEYGQIAVSGTIICPSEIPLSLAKIELFSQMPGSKLVSPYSNATAFTDAKGSFSAALPSRKVSGLQVIARLSCPGSRFPSMTISGNVSENRCSFGTVYLECPRCSGALAAGEEEQMKR